MAIHQTTYRVEMTFVNFAARKRDKFVASWYVRSSTNKTGYGQPTVENLKKYRKAMNDSMKKGGVNAHLRAGQSDYGTARIIHQDSGQVVAEYTPPAFEVV